MTKINFKITPKVTYITSDVPDYEDFKSNWDECHDGEVPCPEENSRKYWEAVSDDQSREWDDFRSNFNHGELIGKTLLFTGHYSSRYANYQPSGDAGRVITINSIDDFMKFTGDQADNVDIWQDKDGLHVSNAHHDGTLSLDVLLLTKNGEKYWNSHQEQSRDVHAHLRDTKGLAKKIDFYLF